MRTPISWVCSENEMAYKGILAVPSAAAQGWTVLPRPVCSSRTRLPVIFPFLPNPLFSFTTTPWLQALKQTTLATSDTYTSEVLKT
jgi:hypothetical protein